MTKKPYPEEFKIEAVKQITERGHRLSVINGKDSGRNSCPDSRSTFKSAVS